MRRTLPNPSHRGRGYDVRPLPSVGEGWGEGDVQVKASRYVLESQEDGNDREESKR